MLATVLKALVLCNIVLVVLVLIPEPHREMNRNPDGLSPLNPSRKEIKVETVKLQSGMRTTVWTAGDRANLQKNTILFLHGFPDTPETWVNLMYDLCVADKPNDTRFFCIAPFLRGYESSSVNDSYHLSDISSDLVQVLDGFQIHPDNRVHVVGHDWGAVVGKVLTYENRRRVRSLSLLSIPPRLQPEDLRAFPQVLYSWYFFFFQLKYIPEWFLSFRNFALVDKFYQMWGPPIQQQHVRLANAAKTVFSQPHTLSSAVSYYRHSVSVALASDLPESISRSLLSPRSFHEMQKLAKMTKDQSPLPITTQVIYGMQDGCMHHKTFEARDESPYFLTERYRIVRLDDCGHFLHVEAHDRVYRLLYTWLTMPPEMWEIYAERDKHKKEVLRQQKEKHKATTQQAHDREL